MIGIFFGIKHDVTVFPTSNLDVPTVFLYYHVKIVTDDDSTHIRLMPGILNCGGFLK